MPDPLSANAVTVDQIPVATYVGLFCSDSLPCNSLLDCGEGTVVVLTVTVVP